MRLSRVQVVRLTFHGVLVSIVCLFYSFCRFLSRAVPRQYHFLGYKTWLISLWHRGSRGVKRQGEDIWQAIEQKGSTHRREKRWFYFFLYEQSCGHQKRKNDEKLSDLRRTLCCSYQTGSGSFLCSIYVPCCLSFVFKCKYILACLVSTFGLEFIYLDHPKRHIVR